MKHKYLTLILALILLPFSGILAQDFPSPMSPPRLVNDFTGLLNQDEVLSLERQLRAFNQQTSTQIYIVTIPDLQGYDPADYTTRLAERWGVGQKGKDNGIMVMVKPKTPTENGELFISVGYGLEGVVPDAVANRISDNEIIPFFKEGANFEGLQQGINTLMKLTEGEFTAEEYMEATARSPLSKIGGIVFFILIFFSLFAGRSRTGRHGSVGRNLPFWLLLGMMSSGSSSHRGMFNNFSSGGGGFGGFGGGGGGSFGGGGAGGSW